MCSGRGVFGTSGGIMIKPGVYRHYKNRQLYLVIGIAEPTGNGDEDYHGLQVVYQALYPTHGRVARMFVRPLDEFTEKVLHVDPSIGGVASGVITKTWSPRFELVAEVDAMHAVVQELG